MARFDYHRPRSGENFLLDCQADTLSHFSTRVVAPLLPRANVPTGIAQLHPVFRIGGIDHVLATHLLSAVPVRELGPRVGSLAVHDREIMNALDMLLTGV